MKKFIYLLCLIIPQILIGQTKKETQDWIKEKIELYSFSDDIDIFNKYVVEYSDKFIILSNHYTSYSSGIKYSEITTFSIPIAELTKIRFEEKTDNVWLFLKIKGGRKLIKKSLGSKESTEYAYDDEIEILLEKSINDDDLKNRLSKAFNHLIELYGGVVIEEKF